MMKQKQLTTYCYEVSAHYVLYLLFLEFLPRNAIRQRGK